MKKVYLITTIILLVVCFSSCKNQGRKKENTQTISTASLNVYYFHFTKRCATCLAVEENARKAVETMYPSEVKTGDFSFTSLNLDEASTKGIADKLGVGGQTMIIVRGDRKIDVTGAVWLAAHDLEKMKVEIKSGIDKVLF